MKILGHRGAKDERPENSLEGIKWALDCGLDGVEIDVHLCADGEFYLMHDDTLERTTNGRGPIKEKRGEELGALELKGGGEIPSLNIVLDLCKDHPEKALFIELKGNRGARELAIKLLDYTDRKNIWVKSFNHRELDLFNSINSQIPAAFLFYCLPQNFKQFISHSYPNSILSMALPFAIIDGVAEECHDLNLKLCAWNANDSDTARLAKRRGIDWLCTDRPSLVNHHTV